MQAKRSLRIASHLPRLPVRQDFNVACPALQAVFIRRHVPRVTTRGYENQALQAFTYADNHIKITVQTIIYAVGYRSYVARRVSTKSTQVRHGTTAAVITTAIITGLICLIE
jgi:hypothetical protein